MKLRALLVILLLIPAPAFAWIRGSAGNTGSAQLGLGATDLVGAFLNEMKVSNFTLGTNSPTVLDARQYPISTPSADIAGNIQLPTSFTTSGVQWSLNWPAGITANVLMNDTLNYVSDNGNCTVNHAVNASITMSGTNCEVIFTVGNNAVALHPHFPASGTFAHTSGDIALVRVSDKASLASGNIFTTEFLAAIQGLNPKTIRPMGWNFLGMNGANLALWAYRANPSDLSYWPTGGRYAPTTLAGNNGSGVGIITGTNTYTAAPATDTNLSAPVAGETIQGKFTNASTANPIISGADGTGCGGNVRLIVDNSASLSPAQHVYINQVAGTIEANGFQIVASLPDSTHVCLTAVPFVNAYSASSSATIGTQTLTVAGRSGATFIASALGEPLGASFQAGITAGGFGTLVYDATLNLYLFTPNPLDVAIPIEVQVSLANKVNTNLWINIPNWFTDASVTSLGTLVKGSLKTSLNAYFEYSNEDWNTVFLNTYVWSFLKAVSIGVPNFRNYFAWYGLRTRQMMDNLKTTWGSQTNLKRVLAVQGENAPASTQQTDRLNGTNLSTANGSLWTTNVPSVAPCNQNYNAAPCRPIDGMDVLAYAPYSQGGNLYPFGGYSASNTAFMQNLANLFSDGVPADTVTAEGIIDLDLRQGTLTPKVVGSFAGATITSTAHGFSNTNMVVPTTTGTLPTGLTNTPPTAYCVVNATANTFQVATNACGSAISLSGGSGTLSFGLVTNTLTMLELDNGIATTFSGNSSNGYYSMWEAVAASYDSTRAGFTPALAALTIEAYEGGFQWVMPTAADCATMGVTAPPLGGGAPTNAGCSAQLVALGEAYKNSPFANVIQLAYFNQFVGKDANAGNFGLLPHHKTPSNLAMSGPSEWSLYPSDITLPAYQYYNGFAAFRFP